MVNLNSPSELVNLSQEEQLILADQLEEEGHDWGLVAWLRLKGCGMCGNNQYHRTESGGKVYIGSSCFGWDWFEPILGPKRNNHQHSSFTGDKCNNCHSYVCKLADDIKQDILALVEEAMKRR